MLEWEVSVGWAEWVEVNSKFGGRSEGWRMVWRSLLRVIPDAGCWMPGLCDLRSKHLSQAGSIQEESVLKTTSAQASRIQYHSEQRQPLFLFSSGTLFALPHLICSLPTIDEYTARFAFGCFKRLFSKELNESGAPRKGLLLRGLEKAG